MSNNNRHKSNIDINIVLKSGYIDCNGLKKTHTRTGHEHHIGIIAIRLRLSRFYIIFYGDDIMPTVKYLRF